MAFPAPRAASVIPTPHTSSDRPLVLGRVDRLGFLEDLARELLVIDIGVATRIASQLGPVDRDHPNARQPLLRAQRQHLAEEAGDRVLMALEEPRDRRVIRSLLRRQHAERNVLLARPLDLPRRPRPARVRVQQQRHHHRRFIGRAAAPVDAISRVEPVEVHLADGVDDKPRKMALRQPLPHIRRHQKRLLAITRDKALAHPQMVLNPPDDTPTYATASPGSNSTPTRTPPSRATRPPGYDWSTSARAPCAHPPSRRDAGIASRARMVSPDSAERAALHI